ncbi:MAG: ATP-binding protein [Patescibacteria group bacterium]
MKKTFGMRSKLVFTVLFVALFSLGAAISGLVGINELTLGAKEALSQNANIVGRVRDSFAALDVVAKELQTLETLEYTADLLKLEISLQKIESTGKSIESLMKEDAFNSSLLSDPKTVPAFFEEARRAGEAKKEALIFLQERKKKEFAVADDRARKQIAEALSSLERARASVLELTNIASVSAEIKVGELSGLARAVRNNIFVISLIGLIFAIAMSMVFVEYVLLTPLRRLSEAAFRFGKGNLGERVDVERGDEMGMLAKSFNLMAANIASTTLALEIQITDRTKNLEDRIRVNQDQILEFEKTNQELMKSTKLLIRRDLELSRANERLRELDSIKSEFISIVAHQLRTPLSGTKWTIDMILRGPQKESLPTELQTMLFKTYESNERMIAFVNDLLDVDRIETGRFQYAFVRMNLADMAESVILEITPQAIKKNVSVTFPHERKEIPEVFVDNEKMRMVFQNLLENAVKYTPDGGKVEVALVREGERLHVSVKDSGIGIPEESLNKIFSRFYRAPNAMKVSTDGSGLGLFISKKIIERHNGIAWFETKQGEGFTFHFTLPL